MKIFWFRKVEIDKLNMIRLQGNKMMLRLRAAHSVRGLTVNKLKKEL